MNKNVNSVAEAFWSALQCIEFEKCDKSVVRWRTLTDLSVLDLLLVAHELEGSDMAKEKAELVGTIFCL